ncbi:acyltransferase domain-containing protein [Aestuariimicrobium ganziense]|uniref:acyltransferase domain-containing protein n=1 Tax=Aestuariimicrobium ganziense TaxID=2773677 RepID=UPI001940D7B5|nr:acyltransferase domain-containing protein [Aestuariimicrobium ganziense]
MDVTQRLNEIDWPTRWQQLGVHEVDREPLQRLVDGVLTRPDELAVVQDLADRVLLPYIGQYLTVFDDDRPGFEDSLADHDLMRGGLPTLALLATADEVHAAHLRRGIPEDLSWQALADFGHQIAKGRAVEGVTSNHNQNWLRNAWSDGFLWLGRLEFEFSHHKVDMSEDAEAVDVIGVHIPDTGPLGPEAVEEAFRMAADLMPRYYPEMAHVEWFTCHSWLLDPQLQELVPGTNIAKFQALWDLGRVQVSDRDGYYFAFNIEPPKGQELPYMLDELPYGSRLHRSIVDLWRSGGHIQAGSGRIPVSRYR